MILLSALCPAVFLSNPLCYFLDGILIFYCIIVTALFCKEKVTGSVSGKLKAHFHFSFLNCCGICNWISRNNQFCFLSVLIIWKWSVRLLIGKINSKCLCCLVSLRSICGGWSPCKFDWYLTMDAQFSDFALTDESGCMYTVYAFD